MRLRKLVALSIAAGFALGLDANNISSTESSPRTTLIDTVIVREDTKGPSVQSLVSATPAPPTPIGEPESTIITRTQVTPTVAPSSESRPVTPETKRDPTISPSSIVSSGLDQKSSEKQSGIPQTKTIGPVTMRTEIRETPTSHSSSISISLSVSTASTSSNPSTAPAPTSERMPTHSPDNASPVSWTQTTSVTGVPTTPTAAAKEPQGSKPRISKKVLMAIVISSSAGLTGLSIALFLSLWHTRRSRRQAQNYCDQSYRSNELKRLQQSPVIQYTGKDGIKSGNWSYEDGSWAYRSPPARGVNVVNGFGKAANTPQ